MNQKVESFKLEKKKSKDNNIVEGDTLGFAFKLNIHINKNIGMIYHLPKITKT